MSPTEYGEGVSMKAIDAMLKRFGFNYIDLVLIHHPINDYIGAWKDLEKAVDQGKIRSIGLSNFEFKQWDEIMSICRIKPAILQVEGHPFNNQVAIKKRSEAVGTLVETWFPVGHGNKELIEHPLFLSLSEKYAKSPCQIILRWHLQMGYIPLPKSTNPTHIKENFDIFDFSLTEEEMAKIAQLPQKRYVDIVDNQTPGSKFWKILNEWKPMND